MAEVQKKCIEFFVLIDADGNWESHHDEDILMEAWTENVGNNEVGPRRMVRVKLSIPLPQPVDVCGDVPEEKCPTIELKVAEGQ